MPLWTPATSSIGTGVLNDRGPIAGSTTYNPGDVVVYQGRRVLVTSQVTSTSGSNPFISGSKFIALEGRARLKATDWSVVGDNATDNHTFLTNALTALHSIGGGLLEIPEGVILTSGTIDIPDMCAIVGQGHSFGGSRIQLANGSNCDVVTMHRSTGSGDSNAFWSGLWNLAVSGNNTGQAAGDFHHCVNVTTNPTNTTQTGDHDFDPGHFLIDVVVRSATGHGYFHSGRSDVRLIGVQSKFNGGIGFYSSFDTAYVGCIAGVNGFSGFYLPSSSVTAAACKSYNNGSYLTWSSGLNWAQGAYAYYNGVLYRALNALTGDTSSPDTDPTNWQSVLTNSYYGSGYALLGNEITLSGCDAQQNTGTSFYLKGTGCHVAGVSAQPNWNNPGGTNALSTSNPNNYAAVALDGAAGCVVDVAATGHNSVTSPIRVVNSAIHNEVVMAGDTTASSTLSSDSISVVGSNNSIRWNGTSLTKRLIDDVDVNVSNPVDGQLLQYVGATGKWQNVSSGSSFGAGIFGDGSDGALTFDGTATISGTTKVSSTYTLTRDLLASSITINNGVTVVPAGYRIFCTGAVTINGTITADGNAGQANGTAGANTGNGILGGGQAGGAGNTGNGSSGTGGGLGVASGGAGGAGSSGTAGSQGFAANTGTAFYKAPQPVLVGLIGYFGATQIVRGGSGGGGGGGDTTNKGGGGGSGGGMIAIFARGGVTIGATGTLTAKGGAGGTPATGNCGGGGGGGGGLIIAYTLSAWTNSGTTTVTGGAAGSGVGTGAAGSAGGNGNVVNFVLS